MLAISCRRLRAQERLGVKVGSLVTASGELLPPGRLSL